MMITNDFTAQTAMGQSMSTVHDYSLYAVKYLCAHLGIDRNKKNWRKQLEPFAPALAAMITAMAHDYDTAIKSGIVAETLSGQQMRELSNGGRHLTVTMERDND